MDIFTLAIIGYFAAIVFIANQHEADPTNSTPWRTALRGMLYSVAVMTFLYGLLIFQAALFNDLAAAEGALPPVDPGAALFSLVISSAAALLSGVMIARADIRAAFSRVLGQNVTYNPESQVHLTAVVLSLAVTSVIIGNFVFSGGIEGLAEALETQGLSFGDLLFQLVIFVLISLLGVGLFIRRDGQAVRTRLGLRAPTPSDLTWGIATGVALYFVTLIFNALWVLTASPEQLAEQTAASEGLAQALNTLPLLLLVSISAPLGEEILFRGALQPVFGIWVSSALFTVLHTQYALTPATLAIFIVSLGFGWLRRRYSTSAAIIAHFAYNFVQLVPLIMVIAAGG